MLPACAYPLKFTFGDMSAVRPDENGKNRVTHTGKVAKPVLSSLMRNMEKVYYQYTEATRRAEKAAAHLHNKYTWDRSGEVLMDILERRYKQWKETKNGC